MEEKEVIQSKLKKTSSELDKIRVSLKNSVSAHMSGIASPSAGTFGALMSPPQKTDSFDSDSSLDSYGEVKDTKRKKGKGKTSKQ